MGHSRKSPEETVVDPALREYAAQMIQQRLTRMLTHQEGVRLGETDEPVHQMRVWSRRTRAALDIFHPCFSGKDFALVEREVKAVTSALGEARDLDVMIASLQKRSDTLPAAERAGVESFVEHLQHRRQASQKALVKTVDHLERQLLAQRFQELAEKQGALKARSNDDES